MDKLKRALRESNERYLMALRVLDRKYAVGESVSLHFRWRREVSSERHEDYRRVDNFYREEVAAIYEVRE